MESTERFGSMNSGRAWIAIAVLAIVVLVGGVLALPRLVYDRFIWQYFWGPIYADAHNAACAVRSGGSVSLLSDTCSQAEAAGEIVAYPGYTLVSEAGYALTLIFMLTGVLFFLQWVGIGRDRRLFFALVPFMFFGGALRVVEDAANAAFNAGAGEIIGYPLNTLIISPVIYFVVFFVTLGALMTALALSRWGVTDGYVYSTAAIGTAALLVTIGYIGVLVQTTIIPNEGGGFYPQMTVLVVLFSTLITGGVYLAADRIAPWVNAGTRRMGLVVLFAQTLDGVANVLAADWAISLGLPSNYTAKHPLNRIIVGIAEGVFPQSVIDVIGTAWPFLLVKVTAAVAVIALFDERIFDESPRYAILLLVAIVAVGLGPGTRDMLRATFGI